MSSISFSLKGAATCPKNSKWFRFEGKVHGTCHFQVQMNVVLGLFLLVTKGTVSSFFSI